MKIVSAKNEVLLIELEVKIQKLIFKNHVSKDVRYLTISNSHIE